MPASDLESAELVESLVESSVTSPNLAKTEDSRTQPDCPDCIDMAEIWDLPDDTTVSTTSKLNVDLTGANLAGADLSNADLSGATGLTQSQLNGAYGNEGTVLPAGLTVKGT